MSIIVLLVAFATIPLLHALTNKHASLPTINNMAAIVEYFASILVEKLKVRKSVLCFSGHGFILVLFATHRMTIFYLQLQELGHDVNS